MREMSFYPTKIPPGRAEGADDWSDYDEYDEFTVDELEEREYDEDGCEIRRDLTYYFPGT